jgi:acyl-CoA dehydrogenase
MQDMNSSPATGFAQLLAAVRKVTQDVAAAHADDVDAKARFPIETLAGLREVGVLSAAVPRELGGAGCNLHELSHLCATLAQSCGSSAMVLAMHYIQLACIARHGTDSEWCRAYLRDLVRRQDLLASMTSEVGTFGDTRSSVCAVRRSDGRFRLDKDATTGSYCAHADAILVTCRRDEEAAHSDQVLVLVKREDAKLTQTSTWDTMGMRGTCSPGFKLESTGDEAQILPAPFADISAQTMVPYSHVLWSSLWWGIAAGAMNKAANFVRGQARQNPGTTPPTATRLAEASVQLHGLKQNWLAAARDFDALGDGPAAREELLGMGWALRLNELKIACSEASPEIVQRALKIVGILGYKNDSPYALGRPLRDALSGALMISNDRIAAKNASMLLVHKEIA